MQDGLPGKFVASKTFMTFLLPHIVFAVVSSLHLFLLIEREVYIECLSCEAKRG